MAFENFPEADKRSTRQQNNSRSWRNILTAILVIALLGTWLYIIWDKNKNKEEAKRTEAVIASTTTQRDELQVELEDATRRYDILKTASSKKDSTIAAKDRDINEKRTRIQTLLSKQNATEAELSEARRLIISLNTDIEGYKNQVELLEGQKIQLTQEKAEVTLQRDRISREYDSAREIIKEKENVIDVGSTLHASNFNIQGINEKSSGREKETDKAKKVDKLRITFDLDENMITPSGYKQLYVVITDPEGKTISEEALGSGTFTTREGQEKIYTQILDINYVQNKRQSISFDWKQSSTFHTGNYRIEVYNNGFKVGEAFIPLKKGGIFG